MALMCRCEKGHNYIQGDIHIPEYSFDEPACPECREEWIKTKMCDMHQCLLKDCVVCQNIIQENLEKVKAKYKHKKIKTPKPFKVSENMLIRAMKKAVEVGVIPKYADEETYLMYWSGMKKVLLAALND